MCLWILELGFHLDKCVEGIGSVMPKLPLSYNIFCVGAKNCKNLLDTQRIRIYTPIFLDTRTIHLLKLNRKIQDYVITLAFIFDS